MFPYFVIDQIALGPIKLYTWGLFVGLGFSAGYLWFYYLARKENLAPKKIAGLALAIFFGAILGAKILAWTLAGGGAMFMGGFVGAITCSWLYVLLVKLPFWRVADLLVLPILLGIAIGRIGCFLINDHQGASTNLPWGILWPDGIARHPVAAYEMLMALGLLAGFWFLQKYLLQNMGKKILPNPPFIKEGTPPFVKGRWGGIFGKSGKLFMLFLFSYSALRFLLDFTRVASGPLADPHWGVLSVSQWLAMGIIFVIIFTYLAKKRSNY